MSSLAISNNNSFNKFADLHPDHQAKVLGYLSMHDLSQALQASKYMNALLTRDKGCPEIEHLKVKADDTNAAFEKFAKFQHLRSIILCDASNGTSVIDFIEYFAKTYSELNKMCFDFCPLNNNHIAQFSQNFSKTLRSVKFRFCDFTDITPLANCNLLESAEFIDCRFQGMLSDISPLQHCNNLQILRCISMYHLQNESLTAIANGCPKLRILHLSDCPNITRISFAELVAKCLQLEDIDLETFQSIHEGDGDELASFSRCQGLRSADFSFTAISYETLKKITENCTKLEKLRLEGCRDLNIAHPAVLTALASIENLRELHIGTLSDWNHCEKDLVNIASKCSNLKVLNMSCFSNHFPHSLYEKLQKARPNLEIRDRGNLVTAAYTDRPESRARQCANTLGPAIAGALLAMIVARMMGII